MPLRTYSFDYLLNSAIVYAAKHEFADDPDALRTAEELAAECEIEVGKTTGLSRASMMAIAH